MTDMQEVLILEYNNILSGRETSFSSGLFDSEKPENRKNNALFLLRYVLATYASFEDDIKNGKLTAELSEKYHLESIIRLLKPPLGFEFMSKYDYAYFLAKNNEQCSQADQAASIYLNYLNNPSGRLPNKFFDGTNGYMTLRICLRMLLSQKVLTHTPNDLYYLFASSEGTGLLEQYGLWQPAAKVFFRTPVDFLHAVLPEAEKNEFYLNYYRLLYLFNAGFTQHEKTGWAGNGQFAKLRVE